MEMLSITVVQNILILCFSLVRCGFDPSLVPHVPAPIDLESKSTFSSTIIPSTTTKPDTKVAINIAPLSAIPPCLVSSAIRPGVTAIEKLFRPPQQSTNSIKLFPTKGVHCSATKQETSGLDCPCRKIDEPCAVPQSICADVLGETPVCTCNLATSTRKDSKCELLTIQVAPRGIDFRIIEPASVVEICKAQICASTGFFIKASRPYSLVTLREDYNCIYKLDLLFSTFSMFVFALQIYNIQYFTKVYSNFRGLMFYFFIKQYCKIIIQLVPNFLNLYSREFF